MKYLIILFISTIIFLSCGDRDDTQGSDAGAGTIVFKHFKLANAREQFDKTIARFEKENPGIRVRKEVLPANTNVQHQFYTTSLEAKSDDFDVFLIDVIWTPEFSLAGWLEDVTDLLPPEERDLFFQAPLEADTYRDRVYAIPWYVDGGLFYYRKDILEKYDMQPPRTFDELVSQARFILGQEQDRKLYGFLWQGKQYEGLICAVNEVIGGFGGQILDENNQLHLQNTQTLRALQWLKDTIYKYEISPEWVLTADEETTRLSFFHGNCLFLRNWPYCWTFFQLDNSKVKDKVGVSLMPSTEGNQGVSTLGGWQMAINRYSKKKAAARKFVRFMCSPEIQLDFALTVGTKPSRISLYQNEILKREQPFIYDLFKILSATRPRPSTPFYPQISQILQVEFSAILADIRPVEEAMRSASRQIEHVLELENIALEKK